MTKYLGSIRRVDCAEAVVVLASGVYLEFRLDPKMEAVTRNLIETKRYRMGVPSRTSILVDGYIYHQVKQEIVKAIKAHRAKMQLPPALRAVSCHPYQLSLSFR